MVSEVKAFVKKRYSEIAETEGCCCGSSCSIDAINQTKNIGYTEEELESIPKSAVLGLGCGNPTAIVGLKEGETVLDLGSGAGIDAFLAAKKVGKNGKVIGVDLTEPMIMKAKEAAKKNGYNNVDFRLGDIENLPVDDASVDVVISNCVVNLTEDKEKAFREAYRVLKKGGRMLISDIVTDGNIPDDIRKSYLAWAGCIAGALEKNEYLESIRKAGFRTVEIASENQYSEPGIDKRIVGKIISVKVKAVK